MQMLTLPLEALRQTNTLCCVISCTEFIFIARTTPLSSPGFIIWFHIVSCVPPFSLMCRNGHNFAAYMAPRVNILSVHKCPFGYNDDIFLYCWKNLAEKNKYLMILKILGERDWQAPAHCSLHSLSWVFLNITKPSRPLSSTFSEEHAWLQSVISVQWFRKVLFLASNQRLAQCLSLMGEEVAYKHCHKPETITRT